MTPVHSGTISTIGAARDSLQSVFSRITLTQGSLDIASRSPGNLCLLKHLRNKGQWAAWGGEREWGGGVARFLINCCQFDHSSFATKATYWDSAALRDLKYPDLNAFQESINKKLC